MPTKIWLNAILIDPVEMTVVDAMVEQDNIRDIYKLIGANCFDVSRVMRLTDEQRQPLSIFVDDEGLLRDERSYFGLVSHEGVAMQPNPVMLAGKGLVLGGVGDEGQSLGCPINADQLCRNVVFTAMHPTRGPAGVFAHHIGEIRRSMALRGMKLMPWLDSEDRTGGGFQIVSSEGVI